MVGGAKKRKATVTTPRSDVLARIRGALDVNGRADSAAEYAAISRTYLRARRFDAETRRNLFVSRLEDYNCGVFLADRLSGRATVTGILSTRGRQRLLAPPGFPADYLPVELPVTRDHALSHAEIESFDGVLTACTVAIAFSGSIVLTHSDAEGRRALTLLPDYHLCVVPEERIVDSLPEALEALGDHTPSLITTISGPSATADIEMTRIRGVHGPRTLDVLIVTG